MNFRRFALAAVAATSPLAAQSETSNPDSARIVTTDVERFWRAFDQRAVLGSVKAFDSLYLSNASPGLRDFARMRIGDAAALAQAVNRDSGFYQSVRAGTLALANEAGAVRQSFRRLAALVPDAVFPDVYVIIGRRSAAGTVSNSGLLIGAEMVTAPTAALSDSASRRPSMAAVVAHELVHYQQRIVGRTLLAMALREGTADFIAELISGHELNSSLHAWLAPREQAVWMAFRAQTDDTEFARWFGAPNDPAWPHDVGYAVGYRIAKASYDLTPDKRAAIHAMLNISDPRDYLARSGYQARRW